MQAILAKSTSRPGDKFGRLTVIGRPFRLRSTVAKTHVVCRCECGNTLVVMLGNLRRGNTSSCGCLNPALAETRRRPRWRTWTPDSRRLFSIWKTMHRRCYDPKHHSYVRYGAKGIGVCQDWHGRDGFERFEAWAMAHGYRYPLTLDRKDNGKGYSPDNCRWATMKEQAANRRHRTGAATSAEASARPVPG